MGVSERIQVRELASCHCRRVCSVLNPATNSHASAPFCPTPPACVFSQSCVFSESHVCLDRLPNELLLTRPELPPPCRHSHLILCASSLGTAAGTQSSPLNCQPIGPAQHAFSPPQIRRRIVLVSRGGQQGLTKQQASCGGFCFRGDHRWHSSADVGSRSRSRSLSLSLIPHPSSADIGVARNRRVDPSGNAQAESVYRECVLGG